MSKKTDKIVAVAKEAGLPELEPFITAVEQKGKDVTLEDADFLALFEKAKELGILNFELLQLVKPTKVDPEEEEAEKDQTTKVDKETGAFEVLNYKGIRYQNGKYYHESDGYAIGFDQADDCARHYNG